MLNFLNVPFVRLQNAFNHTVQRKKIMQNVNTAILNCFFLDMYHLLIVQAMMFSWLQCQLELQLWTQLFYQQQAISLVLNHKLVNIQLLQKLWIQIKLLSYKTKLTLSSKIKLLVLSNKKILKDLLKVLQHLMLQSFLFLLNQDIILTQQQIIYVEFLFLFVILFHLPK